MFNGQLEQLLHFQRSIGERTPQAEVIALRHLEDGVILELDAEHRLHVCDVVGMERAPTTSTEQRRVQYTALSANAPLYAVARRRRVLVCACGRDAPLLRLRVPPGVNRMALNADGSQLVTVRYGRFIEALSLPAGEMIDSFFEKDGFVDSLVVTPDGALVISTSSNRVLRCWNVQAGRLISQIPLEVLPRASQIALSHDGSMFAVASERWPFAIELWRVEADGLRQEATLDGHKAGVHSVAFSPDGTLLASASLHDHHVQITSLQTKQTLLSFEAPEGVSLVTFSPNQRTLLLRLASGASLWLEISTATPALLRLQPLPQAFVHVDPSGFFDANREGLHLLNANPIPSLSFHPEAISRSLTTLLDIESSSPRLQQLQQWRSSLDQTLFLEPK